MGDVVSLTDRIAQRAQAEAERRAAARKASMERHPAGTKYVRAARLAAADRRPWPSP